MITTQTPLLFFQEQEKGTKILHKRRLPVANRIDLGSQIQLDELIDSSDPRSGLTGLEPAASALTGRCSDRLNYNPRKINKESIVIPFFHRERFIPSHKSHFSFFRYGNAMQEVSEIEFFLMMKTRYFKVGNVRRRRSVSDVGWSGMRSYGKEYIRASLIHEFLMIAVFHMLDPLLFYVLPKSVIIPMLCGAEHLLFAGIKLFLCRGLVQ
ncbi:hypothetical protein VNO80_03213 [Phaseolus coccineus]|uniref:NADH-ubiquinone oxidoreductase chain 4 n=1 Tax=Phaseolus coccineus TaxID=3886 RepID=A0AAN9RM98_PHACN